MPEPDTDNYLASIFSSACQSSVLPRDSLPEGGHTEVPLFTRQQEARGWPSSQVLPPI